MLSRSIPQSWSRFLTDRRFLGLSAGAVLVLLLVLSPVGWSAPEEISPQSLVELLNTAEAPLILDVRSPAEYAAGHVPGAINLPYREIPDRLSELAEYSQDDIVVYCEVGIRAGIAEALLEQAGFDRVLTLEGDMKGWRADHLPMATLN